MKRTLKLSLFAFSVFAGLMVGGCEKSLFPQELPRTQFERYDTLRGRYVPAEQENRFGGSEPALRERLSRHRQ
ncbi:MAG: hypothetical protein GC159_08030 [Phycisphaera sp.]|nr:hypothetical protein [Phycisphaera sp.]